METPVVFIGEIMITATSNKRIKWLVSLAEKARERKKEKVFLVEGGKMFEEADEAYIREVYVSESYIEKNGISEKLKKTGYETVSDEVFKKISDTKAPQGILCVMNQYSYTLDMLLEKENPVFVLLEDIQDPGNLGTILRTAEGAGIDGIIMTKDTVDIYNPKTIRATMGSVYRMPFLYVDSLEKVITALQEKNVRVYAAHLEGKEYYDSFDFTKGTAFLIGNEGNGLRKETADLADAYLKIPMEGKVESLNAAIATSLLMYETYRQRRQ